MAKQILIVDDSSAIRKMVTMTLHFKGYEVTAAENGEDALTKLEGGSFDLAIFDIIMPKLDGFGLIEKMKDKGHWDKFPVLMLSTEGMDSNRKRATDLGVTYFLAKPFQPPELLSKIEEVLNEGSKMSA
jgi:two-component system, chemotaxis family, chemotaxis protein CheY